MNISTNRVEQKDFDLLFRTYKEVLQIHIAKIWGWNEEIQKKEFLVGFPNDQIRSICFEEHYVGFLILEKRADHFYLWMLALLPEYQNRGIGRSLLENLLSEAESLRIAFRLNVFKTNPEAKRFFEKSGFSVIKEDDRYFFLNHD